MHKMFEDFVAEASGIGMPVSCSVLKRSAIMQVWGSQPVTRGALSVQNKVDLHLYWVCYGSKHTM